MSRIRSRIPAWIVTSSAVVGSSAISTFGSHASAIAIITRWRMPPESWCGYSSSRRSGAGMRTSRSSSIVRARALAPRQPEVLAQHLADLSPDREHRVQRRHRLLEDERDLAAAHRAQPRAASSESRSTPSNIDAAADRRGLGQQPHERHAGHALAAARLADDPEHLARGRA